MVPFAALLLAASTAFAQAKDAAPSATFGPAARKAAAYVKRFVDPISEALESGATQAARALGSADPNAAAPAEPKLELPDPAEFLRATFLSEPEVRGVAPQPLGPTAKAADFTYRPPVEKRVDSLSLTRRARVAPRPRLKGD